jgi:hypothetical protein
MKDLREQARARDREHDLGESSLEDVFLTLVEAKAEADALSWIT